LPKFKMSWDSVGRRKGVCATKKRVRGEQPAFLVFRPRQHGGIQGTKVKYKDLEPKGWNKRGVPNTQIWGWEGGQTFGNRPESKAVIGTKKKKKAEKQEITTTNKWGKKTAATYVPPVQSLTRIFGWRGKKKEKGGVEQKFSRFF